MDDALEDLLRVEVSTGSFCDAVGHDLDEFTFRSLEGVFMRYGICSRCGEREELL